MKTVFTRLLGIFLIASLAACVLAYFVATDPSHHFYTVLYWLAVALLLAGTVWAFAPVSRRSLAAHVTSLFAAAVSFLFVWVSSSQLIIGIVRLLHNAHAP
jgi:hypothetical protein